MKNHPSSGRYEALGLSAFLLLIYFTLPAQSKPLLPQGPRAGYEINTLYLLLGTLSDHMGRFTYIDKPKQVDMYYYFEKPLMQYIDSIILNNMKIEVTTTFFNGRYDTFSGELSEIINSFYNNNQLNPGIFKTDEEIYSFLAGRFYRYGEQLSDSIYRIQVANSPDHGIIELLLRRIGCTKIHMKYFGSMPAQYIYYFIPTPQLKKIFSQISKQKDALSLSYKKATVSLLGSDNAYEKQSKLKKTKDVRELMILFGNDNSGMTLGDTSLIDRR